jgi:hypothetical protein
MPEWEGAKVPVPEGAYPLFLTATTQTNFKCRERKECTSAQPYVFVSKKFFLDDIQFRGVISDFHPTKKFIEKYPDDTDVQEDGTSGLLIVWDEEEDYGQNFYLVHKVRRAAGSACKGRQGRAGVGGAGRAVAAGRRRATRWGGWAPLSLCSRLRDGTTWRTHIGWGMGACGRGLLLGRACDPVGFQGLPCP